MLSEIAVITVELHTHYYNIQGVAEKKRKESQVSQLSSYPKFD